MKKLFRRLTDNIFTKLSSVLLAVLVWFMVQGEVTTRKVLHGIAVDLTVDSDMILIRKDDDLLRVTLSGPQEVIQEINKSAIKVTHSLRNIRTSGAVVFSLSPEDILVPPRTQVVSIYPKQFKVVLDQIIEKELPVKINWVGNPEPGFQVKDFIVNPDRVRIKGPQSALEKLKEIQTQSLLLTGRRRSFSQTAGLESFLGSDKLEPLPHVDIYVRIEPVHSQVTFEKVPISLLGQHAIEFPVTLTQKDIHVVVEGAQEFVNKVHVDDLKAFVDVSDLKPGKYQVPISIMPVQNMSVRSVEPDTVEVEILGRWEGREEGL